MVISEKHFNSSRTPAGSSKLFSRLEVTESSIEDARIFPLFIDIEDFQTVCILVNCV